MIKERFKKINYDVICFQIIANQFYIVIENTKICSWRQAGRL